MNETRWVIRKARPIDPWAGTWQVWERTNPGNGIHRLERLMCAWKTHADCVAWLDAHFISVTLIDSGEWS